MKIHQIIDYFKPHYLMMLCCVLLCSLSFQTWAFNASKLVQDAKRQIGKTQFYDPAYTRLQYPMGDVPLIKGVCTDVVIRALREQGIDLQKNIYEDMKANFKVYPQKWGLKGTDHNIDHRRVPNIMTYFSRKGFSVLGQTFQAGDIVTWDLGRGLVHIGIVSDNVHLLTKTPYIIHNIGAGTLEENILHDYKITGHYRVAKVQ